MHRPHSSPARVQGLLRKPGRQEMDIALRRNTLGQQCSLWRQRRLVLHSTFFGDISTLDLSDPLPSVTTIMRDVVRRSLVDVYLALAPSGELLQVWRMRDLVALRSFDKDLYTYQYYVNKALEGCIDFAGDDDNKERTKGPATFEQDIEVQQQQQLEDEVSTTLILGFKVDIGGQKLLELRDIRDHALFLGFNASICLLTNDLSGLKSSCTYLMDDCDEYNQTL